MEQTGVTRKIHEDLKPLLENMKDAKGSMSGVMFRHATKLKNISIKAQSKSNEPVYSSGRSGLFDAVFHAYFSHLPLVLNPDHIWLAILQGVGFHVTSNAEKLRNKLVDFQGQKELTVIVDPWQGTPEDWQKGFQGFNKLIIDNLKPQAADLLVGEFSTTTPLAQAVTNLAIMDCFQSFFKYMMRCGCGLPQVTLEGTLEDWQSLTKRAKALVEYVEMNFWLPYLLPVLQEFENFYSTGVNLKFWDCIYKPMPAVGSGIYWDDNVHQYHAGWIVNFFPYTIEGSVYSMAHRLDNQPAEEKKEPSKAMKTLEELYEIHDKYLGRLNKETSQDLLVEYLNVLGGGVKDRYLPSGLSKAPLKVEDMLGGKTYPAETYAGFFGYTLDNQTHAIKPALGWYLAEVTGPAPPQVPL
jgi:hypothetical protein